MHWRHEPHGCYRQRSERFGRYVPTCSDSRGGSHLRQSALKRLAAVLALEGGGFGMLWSDQAWDVNCTLAM